MCFHHVIFHFCKWCAVRGAQCPLTFYNKHFIREKKDLKTLNSPNLSLSLHLAKENLVQ